MRDLDTARGRPRDPEYTRETELDPSLDVRRSYSCGVYHVTIWRGCRRLAWGCGFSPEEAERWAMGQLRGWA